MVATYTQLLAERYQGKLDENADKYIHYAVDGALRMQTLVQDLLAFSRVGRQGNELNRWTSIWRCKSALKTCRPQSGNARPRSTTGNFPRMVADDSQLAQVFQNLIGNAIKFRGARGATDLASRRRKKTGNVSFRWRTTESGSLREHAETIFVIFKRLHTREEYSGKRHRARDLQENRRTTWRADLDGVRTRQRFDIQICLAHTEARGPYDHDTENRR